MADNLTKEQRHKNMSHIKSKDTSIEVKLRKELWKKGYRYRKNYNKIPGKPDIAITKYKIAIFCDSEFFHGKNWEILKLQLKKEKDPDFWIKKIEHNQICDWENDKKVFGLYGNAFLGAGYLKPYGRMFKGNRRIHMGK